MRSRQHSGTFTLSEQSGMMQTVWKLVALGCTVIGVRRERTGGAKVVFVLFVTCERCRVDAVELV